MARGRNSRYNKISSTAVAVVVIIFIVLYILDALFGLSNSDITGDCEFHFIDVGQGDCSMVISEDGVVVVDAGPGDHSYSTLEYISGYTNTIDYLVLTHPHEDHIGGAADLIENLCVKNIILSDASTDTVVFTRLLDVIEDAEVNVIQAVYGEEYNAGSIDIKILSPISEFTDYNDYSIVTKIQYGETSTVITGDVENHSEGLIIDNFLRTELRTDIFKVGHHGSYTSNSAKFIDALSPEYAVISCGKGNSYGHPHRETIDKLNKRDITYYRTDEVGSVVFISDGYEVEYLSQ